MSTIYLYIMYMYLCFQDLDAIAVTTEPGLAPCLGIGLGYAKELVAESGCVVNKVLIYIYLMSEPFVPITTVANPQNNSSLSFHFIIHAAMLLIMI